MIKATTTKLRKQLFPILSVILVISLCACGVGKDPANPADADTTLNNGAPQGGTEYLSFGTGTTGGVFYTAGIGIGSLLNDKAKNLNITVEATKASAENCNLLADGSIELATMSFPTTLQAFTGDGAWAGKPQDLQVLFNMYGNPIHIIVMADSPYKTMEDLKGKTISVGQAGSGNYNTTIALLEGVYGWVEGVDYKAEYLSYSESEEAFKNGVIDAAVFDTVAPHSTIIDLASWKDIRLIGLDQTLLDNVDNVYAKQFYTITIPSGTYTGQAEDIVCAAHGNYVVTNGQMSEDLAYEIVTTVFQNLDYMGTVHEAMKNLTAENGCETGGLAMHAGAKKYFTEQGIDVESKIEVVSVE